MIGLWWWALVECVWWLVGFVVSQGGGSTGKYVSHGPWEMQISSEISLPSPTPLSSLPSLPISPFFLLPPPLSSSLHREQLSGRESGHDEGSAGQAPSSSLQHPQAPPQTPLQVSLQAGNASGGLWVAVASVVVIDTLRRLEGTCLV